ncbi:sensor histidine kinase [Lutispora thermophila]|uniref:GHKL domain-containing protein n=1 Tax=Lutispora thermophila DSM 19022 TaxID=1122184 RepID=A0A1M6DV93_9FIRM|nr:ATP-binding protein [Lutispora thermophila]SHI77142.1 GHKL domain-containing protein [Lutispora thermophila DSM 19022]
MIETVIGLVRFGFSLVFGVMVSVLLAGIESTRKNRFIIASICLFFLFIQLISWWTLGLDLTSKLYPIIVHVPMIMILSLYYKFPWHISVISILTAYLCCQVPRWIGFLAGAALRSKIADHIFYIVAVFVSFYLFKRYVVSSIRQLMLKSPKSCLLLGGVPLFYYIFDYVTTIYTDVLYSGARWAVQFMPSTISVFYFIFVILYYIETEKQANYQRERGMLDIQLRQAQTELESLRKIQENAAAYRHDMRHHFALIQGLTSKGLINEISHYLKTVQSDIDAITPVRYCENETVNLIISSFATKSEQEKITFTIDVKLPDLLTFSDTELCSLLSNALENAIHSCRKISNINKRYINLRMYSKNNKLCIDIRNSCETEPTFHQGLPVSKEKGHGYGTKSMAHIVEKHGGVFQFMVKDGWFIFQATA